ncbi:MAG TPA: PAS domain S-box protein, partial [Gaiellaceae bacterium]|nr:PAS domain S-box protein [Gaiellaceae bacterium]
MRGKALVVAWLVALALAAGATVLVLTSDHDDNKAATIALALTAGLTFVGSGLLSLWRRPENRTGYLLAAVGYIWFLGALTESSNDWAFTVGSILGQLAFGAFAHLLLAFPEGRLTSARDRIIVWFTYALVLGATISMGLVERTPDPNCDSCRSTIALGDSELGQSIVQWAFNLLALALLALLLRIVAGRYLRATTALRRVLGPVLAAGALTLITLVLQVVVGAFSEDAARPLGYVFLVTFGMVPFAFLAGVLRSRLARSAVADLLLALGRGASLRDALARALHDPSLEVVFWLPERGIYVWHDGNEFHDEGGPRLARYVARNGQRVAAILHDPALADDPELVDAVAEAAGLWLENERLQAELRAQVDFLETIVNTAPSLLMSLDLEGRIVNFNTATGHASGYANEEEARGRPFWEVFIAETDRERVRREFEGNPDHPPAVHENTFVNARGEELVIAWSTAPLLDDKGHVRNIICGGLDVTVRKLRELELARERDFLRTLADGTPSLLVVVDAKGTIVGNSVNTSFERTIGWTEQEMLGRSFFDVLRDDERAAGRTGVAAAFAGTQSVEQISHWCTRDGRERVISWTVTPIVDADGHSLALVVGVDVTERERREAKLRSSEERLHAAIEASPVAIVEYALDDTITRWNPA